MANEMNMIPNNGMLMVATPAERPAAISGGENSDPRVWKPKVTKDNQKYRALVRQLPRGRDLAAYPAVQKLMHYLHDPVSGLRRPIPCCKNIPGVTRCPTCDDIWARVDAVKAANPGLDKKSLGEKCKPLYRQLAEVEWWGNYLIVRDENHPELENTVKVWNQSRYQHEVFETPVQKFRAKQQALAAPSANGGIEADTGDAFIPYDPVVGRDYLLDGKWDGEKSFGDGRKGNPTYKDSAFVQNPRPIAPTTDGIYAILDQCYDLSFVYDDVPNEQQAIEKLAEFWNDANKRAQARANRGYGSYGAQNMAANPAQSPMFNPAFAAQPFMTGNAPMPQNSIPNIPPTTKVQSGLGGGTGVFGGAPQQQLQAPAVPQQPTPTFPTGSVAPAPISSAAAPAIPAFAIPPATPAAPAMAPAGVQPAPSIGAGTGYIQAQPVIPPAMPQVAPAMPQVAPAMPQVAPAMPQAAPVASYVPPAAPPIQQPVGVGMNPPPPQGNVVSYETDSDDDLPF